MPSDTSINLRTSAAAAFFARLLVHPLDNIKVSIQHSKGVPEGIVPRLEHLLSTFQRQLHARDNKSWQDRTISLGRRSTASFAKDRVSFCRGVYKGVSFALLFQVPALALFLSTYDGTKNGLANMAHSAGMSTFHVHHFETHMVSGLMAKMAGTTLWAPMNRIQSMTAHPAMPMTLKEAFRLTKQVCRSEGLSGLWSGYGTTLSSLLPYTILYFASYEQFKQMARWMVVEKAKNQDGNWSILDALQDYWTVLGEPGRVPVKADLAPETFMMCITGAVVSSSFVCQTASAVRSMTWDRLVRLDLVSTLDTEKASSLRRPHSLPNLLQSFQTQPSLPLSPHSPTKIAPPSALSVAGAAGFKCHHPAAPSQFKTLMSSSTTVARQALGGLPWQQSQHATLTTTSLLHFRSSITHQHHLASMPLKGHVHPVSALAFMPASSFAVPSYASPISSASSVSNNTVRQPTSYKPGHMMTMMTAPLQQANLTSPSFNDNESTRKIGRNNSPSAVTATRNGNTPGLFRTIARGLGPRIMWTIPGVTLTTAGFEVLRSLAA
ncbi:MAG: mitochondrial carrier domain-containing protein [Linnemannia gamsii]|nr:MAG: mitochondrial carrier domain-containing protein [Linnemannia gamsii]